MAGNKPDCSAPGQFEWQPGNFECGKLPPENVIPFLRVTMQTRLAPLEKRVAFSLSFVASFILDLAVCAYLSKEVKRVHLSLGTSLFRFRLASDSARSRSSNLRIKQNGRGVFHNDKEHVSIERARKS